jgi:hypothetical protein
LIAEIVKIIKELENSKIDEHKNINENEKQECEVPLLRPFLFLEH